MPERIIIGYTQKVQDLDGNTKKKVLFQLH